MFYSIKRNNPRDNIKWHYIADPDNPDSILVDYDGVSLYPSAISRLWLTEGEPILIKGSYSASVLTGIASVAVIGQYDLYKYQDYIKK